MFQLVLCSWENFTLNKYIETDLIAFGLFSVSMKVICIALKEH